MAIYYARKTGNINAADVWATTPTGTAADVFSSFTNADTLVANSFVITINVNTTVLELRNDTTGGATSGGTFTINNSITLTSNVIATTTNNILNYNGISPNSCTIIGNIYGGSGGSSTPAVTNGSSGTLNIIGNVYGGVSSNANGVGNTTTGTINITGNTIGGIGTGTAHAVVSGSAAGIINITGNVVGGFGQNGTCYGASITAGTLNVIGVAIGGTTSAAVNNSSVANITRAKGNDYGPGSAASNSVVGVIANQNSVTRVNEIEYGSNGQSPTSGPIILNDLSSNVAVFRVRLSGTRTLVDSSAVNSLIPASGDVRSGVTYNQGNNTGSCIIPNANSVVYGVAVDNTVGSGLLSPVAVWNVLASSISTSGSIGQRLKNCSTVSTVGKQLEGAL